MPGTTLVLYKIFDADHHPCLDLNASAVKVAPLVEAALKEDGHDVTVAAHPNGLYSELQVRGLRLDGYKAHLAVHDALMDLGDDVWILEEDECDDH